MSVADRFVELMEDRRVRIAGIALAAVTFVASMGLLVVSKGAVARIEPAKVLPDVTPNVTVLRASPYPEVRVMELRALAPAVLTRPSVAPGRSKTFLSRR